jgi:hypothetical protein
MEGDPAPENLLIAMLLLQFAADVNAVDLGHQSPLMRAAKGVLMR